MREPSQLESFAHRRSRGALPLVRTAALALLLGSDSARPEDAYPDIDLSARCPGRVEARSDAASVVVPVGVFLTSHGKGVDAARGVRAWSLGLRPDDRAFVRLATTEGTDLPPTVDAEGYEKTELALGSPGAVSAVILSLLGSTQLPVSGDYLVLRLEVEAEAPASGCRPVRVEFVDGLVGSGQPVKNTVSCGEGVTRRDDGGELDNDRDSYEQCEVQVCAPARFLRGDANADLQANIADGLFLLDHLFRGSAGPLCARAGDVNADSAVNVSDPVHLLNHLFRGGAQPAPPYPECAAWEGDDTLDCAGGTGCGEEGERAGP